MRVSAVQIRLSPFESAFFLAPTRFRKLRSTVGPTQDALRALDEHAEEHAENHAMGHVVAS